jgi:glycosyltransferase involved in cell wall biosynthesis
MRIAVWHNLPSGGGKRALYYHVRGLVEHGHTVESWCPATADQSYLPLNELITEHVIPLAEQPSTANNRVARLRALYGARIQMVKALDDHCRECAVQINQGNFDLLFANTAMGLHAGPIGRYVRIPKVLYLQEPNRWLYEALPHLPWIAPTSNGKSWWNPTYLKSRIPDWLNLEGLRVLAREELISAKAYDVILVNSLFSRESIMRSYGLNAKVCYLGVDTSLFRPLSKTRERFIVGVGAVLRFKGIELAIRSVALLNDPQLTLAWVANSGDPEYAAEMRKLAAALNVNLQLKMRVSDTELVDILNRAALMLYTPQLEPFGFAPLEANACATPVVAVAEGGVRETVKNNLNGLLVAPEPRSIAQAIEKLLNDPVLTRRLGEQAVEYVRSEWSVERSIDRLEACLLESVEKDLS